MKARDLIERLQQVDGDTEIFRSHGDFSREVLDAEITPMCSYNGIRWQRCFVGPDICPICPNPYRHESAVLIL